MKTFLLAILMFTGIAVIAPDAEARRYYRDGRHYYSSGRAYYSGGYYPRRHYYRSYRPYYRSYYAPRYYYSGYRYGGCYPYGYYHRPSFSISFGF
jgi:hypothetical protein